MSPKFPTINIEGEIGGEDWDDTAEDVEDRLDVRRLTGSVSMLGDGSVRWSMVSNFSLLHLTCLSSIIVEFVSGGEQDRSRMGFRGGANWWRGFHGWNSGIMDWYDTYGGPCGCLVAVEGCLMVRKCTAHPHHGISTKFDLFTLFLIWLEVGMPCISKRVFWLSHRCKNQ